MKKIQKSKKGFTLVEMVLVIAIIVSLQRFSYSVSVHISRGLEQLLLPSQHTTAQFLLYVQRSTESSANH